MTTTAVAGGSTQQIIQSAFAGRPGALQAAWAILSEDQRRAIIKEPIGPVTIYPKGAGTNHMGSIDRLRVALASQTYGNCPASATDETVAAVRRILEEKGPGGTAT